MANRKPKNFPQFESLDDLVDFVDRHDLGEYLERMPKADFEVDLEQKRRLFAHNANPDSTKVKNMSNQSTLEELEQQVAQLSPRERLKLMAHIAEQLNSMPLDVLKEENPIRQQREQEADEILALCDAAAEMWEGEFDAAAEIRLMRKERDEQIWPNKS